MSETGSGVRPRYGPQRLIVELANICNLRCSYCMRDEEALYHQRASFFPIELLRRVMDEARAVMGATHISFTGGEPTLHPRFNEILAAVGEAGLQSSFVTNGWHFERVWPSVQAHRAAINSIAFSLDGATREAHDRWRGEGSFVRLIRAITRCRVGGVPFILKVALRRDTVPQLEQLALMAARLGATELKFAHLLPTSRAVDEELGLSADERLYAEQEIATLARIFRMPVRVDVGYYNTDPAPPCAALAAASCNIDYRGRLSLCCNISGYRGAAEESDVVADLNDVSFAEAYGKLSALIEAQMDRRRRALAAYAESGAKPDLETGAPCLFCLHSFGKTPWQDQAEATARSLPVLTIDNREEKAGRVSPG